MGGVQRRIVLGVHEQQRVAGAPEDRLGTQHDVGHQRVGDVGEHEPDREGLAAPQALGQEVGLVVELATADRTRSRIWALTSGWPDRTRDTDEIATSARSATSRMLARLRVEPLWSDWVAPRSPRVRWLAARLVRTAHPSILRTSPDADRHGLRVFR